MTAARRRIATTRRVDLDEYGDGLEGSYAIVTLMTYDEMTKAVETTFDTMTNVEATGLMLAIAKEHFVSGKIGVLNAAGEVELVDMEARDIQASSKMINALYLTVMGVALDPKAMPTAPSSSNASTSDENSTKTSSSTESPETQTQA